MSKSYTRYFDRSIHDREEVANQRGRLGDYEGDTVYGSVGRGYLATAVDQMTQLTGAAIASDKTLESTNAAFLAAFDNATAGPHGCLRWTMVQSFLVFSTWKTLWA